MTSAERFEKGVVFRLCIGCRKLVGCWYFGQINDCSDCSINCPFRGAQVSVEGFQLLESMDSNTSTMCDECSIYAMERVEKQYPTTKTTV